MSGQLGRMKFSTASKGGSIFESADFFKDEEAKEQLVNSASSNVSAHELPWLD